MAKSLLLTPALRRELKKPLGRIGGIGRRPAFLLVGGDEASRRLARLKPDVRVFDCKVKRRNVAPLTLKPTYSCSNPAGSITSDALRSLAKAVANPPATVRVNGEEDLLALPALLLCPPGGAVAYGQPGKGLVLVKADQKNKKKALRLLARFREN